MWSSIPRSLCCKRRSRISRRMSPEPSRLSRKCGLHRPVLRQSPERVRGPVKILAKRLTLATLRGYKRMISPLFLPACRYVPTCSEYAMEAVDRYGVLRGMMMATWRVLRCHPFSKGGYDPVTRPDKVNCRDAAGCVFP